MLNMKKWAADIIAGPQRIAIPIMTHPGIELCGYTVKEAVIDGEKHFKSIKKLDETYPAAASTVIMDLTVEAEAFGARVNFPENEVPTVLDRLVSDHQSVEALKIPDLNQGRVQEYLKANRLTAESIKDKPVFAGCIGPFSLAGRLYGMTEIMMGIYTEPETVTLLLEKCTAFILRYCEAIKLQGVNGVIMAEPAAGLISNEDCSAFSSVYIKLIVDKLQDENFMIVLHNCGNTGHCTPAMVETGAAGLHFGNKIDMLDALKESPSDVLVMGNLDPAGLLKNESAEVVYETTMNLLKDTATYKNYILSSGCDVPPCVPAENIKAFYKALDVFNG